MIQVKKIKIFFVKLGDLGPGEC